MQEGTFRIGKRAVGPGHKPVFIAEVSANHNGTLDNALAIIREAAECGAEAIKLQTFTPASLTIDSHRPEFFIEDADSPWHGRRLWELYEEAYTPWEWHEPIFREARSRGLLCISTAFDQSSIDFLCGLGVDALKIASFELVHIPLVEAAARTGLPVLLSTGMAELEEIDLAVSALRENSCDRFVLLKCTSAYPSVEKDANLLTMGDMRKRYRCAVGLSDHTLRPHTACAATALGAVIIEKHLTLDRRAGGPDSSFSLEPSELRAHVDGVELVWQSLGEVNYRTLPAEQVSKRERPSIYAVRPIKKGEAFNSQNLRIIRPSSGLAPRHLKQLLGKKARCDIAAESPITWDLVAVESP